VNLLAKGTADAKIASNLNARHQRQKAVLDPDGKGFGGYQTVSSFMVDQQAILEVGKSAILGGLQPGGMGVYVVVTPLSPDRK
jgi:hypothetical protein